MTVSATLDNYDPSIVAPALSIFNVRIVDKCDTTVLSFDLATLASMEAFVNLGQVT